VVLLCDGLCDVLELMRWVVSWVFVIFFSGVFSESDVEDRMFLLHSHCVLIALELPEDSLIQRNDHVQARHASVEGVGYQQSGVEEVQRTAQHDVAEASPSE
jgi:hypothetical protein